MISTEVHCCSLIYGKDGDFMISIIVPIYKVEKYLDKCVNSILNQTYKDLEIILVDDGSPDNCPEMCDDFAKRDSRVKVVHKQNGGLMSARQAGLRVSKGDYVGFVDGDDWIEPDMYMHFHNAVSKYNSDIIVSEFYFDFGDEQNSSSQNLSKPFFTKDEMINEIYPVMLFKPPYYNFGINPCCWAKLFKKELLEKCLYSIPTEIKIGEDTAFTYPCLIYANSMAYVDKPCYHYMDSRDGSMTSSYDADMENTIFIPYYILKKEFGVSGYDFLNSLDNYAFYLFEFIIRNEACLANKKSGKEIIKTLKKFTENKEFILALKNINSADLPLRKKFLTAFIKMKSNELIYVYIRLLRRLG